MKKGQRAEQLFLEGYNCAQSVLMAFSEEVGMEEKTLARLASSFGGGMGRMREVCGAVSGMFMVAGLLYGYDEPTPEENDLAQEKKTACYEMVQKLAEEFKEKHETILCREILDRVQENESHVPEIRSQTYYENRPCQYCVKHAAEIMENYMKKF